MAGDRPAEARDGLRANRRDLVKGLVLGGGAANVDSRSDALQGLLGGESSGGSTGDPGGRPAVGSTQASTHDDGNLPDPIPVRAMENVSVRDIAESTSGVSGPKIDLRNVAQQRGLTGVTQGPRARADLPFALRELVTSQKIQNPNVVSRSTSSHRHTWHNWVNDHERQGLLRIRPNTKRELIDAVLFTAREDERIRAVGAGHSHSKVAAPEEHFLQLSWYDSSKQEPLTGLIDPLPHKWLGPVLTNDLVRVEAGATIKYLNRKLLLDNDKALKNQGSFDAQTLAGAINTSTHGTGERLGAVSDEVQSVELIAPMESPAQQGKLVVRSFRIEPENGITDREAFEDDVGTHGTTLIQDDDVFNSVVVGYGSLGIAYAYTMEVRDKYFLHEDRRTKLWNDFKNDIPDLRGEPDYSEHYTDADGARHFQFLVNIAQVDVRDNEDPNPRCFLISHREFWKYDGAQQLDRWPSEPGWWSGQGTSWPPERTGKTAVRELVTRIKGKGLDPTDGVNNLFPVGINRRFAKNSGDQSFEFDPPAGKSIFSSQTPNGWRTASYVALRRKTENHPDPFVEPVPPPMAVSTEIAVPADQVVTAVEEAFEAIKDSDMAFHVPMGVRFVARSEHHLAPEYRGPNDRDVPVAKVEVPFIVEPVKTPLPWRGIGLVNRIQIPQDKLLEYAAEGLGDVEQRLLQASADGRLDFARPHMGKTNTVSDLSRHYERFETWEAIHRAFDAFGTFDNGFTARKNVNVE